MKTRFRILIIGICLLLSVNIYAQQTSMTIDNQTPGWLSSKINYGDQVSLENLTVSGYVNLEDMKFIGTLIQQHSLKGRLDLEEVQYIDETGNLSNIFPKNVFGFISSDIRTLQTLKCPKSLIDVDEYWSGNLYCPLELDTLIIGGYCMKEIQPKHIPTYRTTINVIKIREGVETFEGGLKTKSNTPEKNVSALTCNQMQFPSTLKKIAKYSFANSQIRNINLPDSLEEIGEYAFLGCTCFGNKVILPLNLKQLYTNIFYKAVPKVFFVGPNVTTINNRYYYDKNSGDSWHPDNTGYSSVINDEVVEIYLFSTNPPEITHEEDLSKVNVYVPLEKVQVYTSNQKWGKLNITGIDVSKEIQFNLPDYLYVGDVCQLNEVSDDNLPIIWECNNADAVRIYDFKFECLKYGEVNISARYLYQTVKYEKNVNIYEHTNGIQLGERELTVLEGEKFNITAITLPINTSDNRIVWTSEDDAIVSISKDGRANAINVGVVYLTATTLDGNYTKECRVEVVENNSVDGVDADNNAEEITRYDIHGRKLNEPTKGINIIKMSDGSTRKEVVK
ncbi:MAG: leucine-rich repeat protein [Muribaculaceae bacterium]|nr:leucine-rich repeat protein [Muribaculaceae bacterium]